MLVTNRSIAIFLYSTFSWIFNVIWVICELLPPIFRGAIFKILFKKFGDGCLVDYGCYFRYAHKISIANNVAINHGCELYASMQSVHGTITLMDYAVLGPKVIIFTASHDYTAINLPDISAQVIVCRYAWVGGNTTILPGVTIGEGAVIGAGSVVTKDVPPWSVAVGNPAKVIKSRSVLSREAKQQMARR